MRLVRTFSPLSRRICRLFGCKTADAPPSTVALFGQGMLLALCCPVLVRSIDRWRGIYKLGGLFVPHQNHRLVMWQVEPGGQVDGAGSDCFTASEIAFYLRLNTPALVQDYLDTLPMNHETEDDTCLSALEATRQNCGHCIEGAMIGAFILSLHGHPPYLCDVSLSLSAFFRQLSLGFRILSRRVSFCRENHAISLGELLRARSQPRAPSTDARLFTRR
jgi:hypothetical protein